MPYHDIVTTFTILEDTRRLLVYTSSIYLERQCASIEWHTVKNI